MATSAHAKYSTSSHQHIYENITYPAWRKKKKKGGIYREGYFDCFEINLQLSDRKK